MGKTQNLSTVNGKRLAIDHRHGNKPPMSQFKSLRKCILSQEQLSSFQSSKVHKDVVSYVETLNDAVVGVKLTDECAESPVGFIRLTINERILCIYRVSKPSSTCSMKWKWLPTKPHLSKIPRRDSGIQHLGHSMTMFPKYVWLQLSCILTSHIRKQLLPSLHEKLLNLPKEAIPEVSGYFKEAWGSRSRIDYGSGMELNFLCWL